MNKTLLGVGLIIISIAAFFMWINPHYANVKVLSAQLADSKSALAKAQQLNIVKTKLVDQENSISPDNIAKLQKLLPNGLDSVRFIIDIQNIAAAHGLTIQDVSAGDSRGTTQVTHSAVLGPSSKPYSETQLSFSITTSYSNLVSFLQDMEKSLNVIEVKSLAFSVDDKNPSAYKVLITVGSFWMNQSASNSTVSS